MKTSILLAGTVLGTFFLAACGAVPAEPDTSGPEPTEGPSTEAEVEPESDEQPEPAAEASGDEQPPAAPATEVADVTIEGSDGLQIVGTFYPGSAEPPWPGVILLHMLGSNRAAWNDFPQALADRGYATLAIDMRGHGETGGSQDWDVAVDDFQRVWSYLDSRGDVDGGRTAVVGASIGANMALVTGAGQPEVDTVVLLSPGLNYAGVTTEDALDTYGARPLLIIASDEDGYAASSSQSLADLAQGDAELVMYQGAGHGTNMFRPQPDLGTTIVDWLDKKLQ